MREIRPAIRELLMKELAEAVANDAQAQIMPKSVASKLSRMHKSGLGRAAPSIIKAIQDDIQQNKGHKYVYIPEVKAYLQRVLTPILTNSDGIYMQYSAIVSDSDRQKFRQIMIDKLKQVELIKGESITVAIRNAMESAALEIRKNERSPGKLFDEEKRPIVAHLEDRMIAPESAFIRRDAKLGGVSAGYVAERGADGKLFMMKHALKAPTFNRDDVDTRNESFDNVNAVNEFVIGPLYKRVLYDRTPIVEGVRSVDPNHISIRSKFLHEFQTATQFTNNLQQAPNSIGKVASLEHVQGAEKLFAAMLFAGEYDVHANNFGVMKTGDKYPPGHPAAGQDVLVYSKIDHGWSGTQLFTSASKMMENLSTLFSKGNTYGFFGNIKLNLGRFKKAVDEIAKISDDEIMDSVATRIGQLKKMGMDIRGLEFPCWQDDTVHDYRVARPGYLRFDTIKQPDGSSRPATVKESYALLESHYRENFIRQRDVMRDVGARLEIIERIEFRDGQKETEDWKNNGWWLTSIKVWIQSNGRSPKDLLWLYDLSWLQGYDGHLGLLVVWHVNRRISCKFESYINPINDKLSPLRFSPARHDLL